MMGWILLLAVTAWVIILAAIWLKERRQGKSNRLPYEEALFGTAILALMAVAVAVGLSQLIFAESAAITAFVSLVIALGLELGRVLMRRNANQR